MSSRRLWNGIGIAAPVLAIGCAMLWFSQARAVDIPENRALFVGVWLAAAALGMAALVKAGWIGRLAAVSDLECEDVRIRILGDTAILHGRTTYTKPDDQPGAGRYTDIWMLRDGRWLCVAAHVTRG